MKKCHQRFFFLVFHTRWGINTPWELLGIGFLLFRSSTRTVTALLISLSYMTAYVEPVLLHSSLCTWREEPQHLSNHPRIISHHSKPPAEGERLRTWTQGKTETVRPERRTGINRHTTSQSYSLAAASFHYSESLVSPTVWHLLFLDAPPRQLSSLWLISQTLNADVSP